jgi:CIC family chloride channel protein
LKLDKFNIIQFFVDKVHTKLNERQFLLLSSSLVGISAGFAAVILKSFVHFIREYIIELRFTSFHLKYLYLLLPLIGIGISIFLLRRFFKRTVPGGSANILHAIAKKGSFLPLEATYSHIFTSAFTIGFGGSAGLESPIVNTGSAIGSNYSRVNKLNYKERTLLLAAGAAGGIAGAFNAPIAGVLFALEVILADITITAFIPLLIAAASGALVSKIILREDVLLNFSLLQPFDYRNVPFYILLGLLTGLISVYYVNAVKKTERFFQKRNSVIYKWILGSVLLGLMIAAFPSLFGEGYNSIKSLSELDTSAIFKGSVFESYLKDDFLIFIFIVLTMLLKVFATSVTLGGGGNGGNFAPSLFVGAYLGFAFTALLRFAGFDNIPISNFTIVAMAGILTGVFHAPLTGIFLIAEITGGYELMIPLMIVSSISYVLVKRWHPQSMDVTKLKEKGTIVSENKDISLLGKINIHGIIDRDFMVIHISDKLGKVVEQIKQSKRNTFPVLDAQHKLQGLIQLDNIREEIFRPELYEQLTASDLLEKPTEVIKLNEDIFSIMKKFERSGQWNLPVTDSGTYVGFISKSSILLKYREELLSSV